MRSWPMDSVIAAPRALPMTFGTGVIRDVHWIER